ncbi:MAG: mechanosensitive ion channel [Caulobacter sp.]|nr:mechanosensitive ion channel [Caulobacter sp.]
MTLPEQIDPRLQQALTGADSLVNKFTSAAGDLAINLTVAIIILAVTAWAAGWLSGVVKRSIARLSGLTSGDATLRMFAGSAVRYGVWIVGFIAVLQQLGVQATSIIAVLGAASLAIGLAMQGALSNVAAGVMLLILRPYRVGDVVEISSHLGTVKALDLFTTELTALDGLKVVVPNGKVFGELIINYSSPAVRRMEITIGIDYDDNIQTALDVMLDAARADPRILADPEPWSRCTGFGDSAINITLRAWAPLEDYWDAYHGMFPVLKARFDAAGLSIPYPHQVNVEKTNLTPAAKPAKAGKSPKAT